MVGRDPTGTLFWALASMAGGENGRSAAMGIVFITLEGGKSIFESSLRAGKQTAAGRCDFDTAIPSFELDLQISYGQTCIGMDLSE